MPETIYLIPYYSRITKTLSYHLNSLVIKLQQETTIIQEIRRLLALQQYIEVSEGILLYLESIHQYRQAQLAHKFHRILNLHWKYSHLLSSLQSPYSF